MNPPEWLDVSPDVRDALHARRPVVALESTLIAHGLPWPDNVETALKAERVIREVGAVPATIAVLKGRPAVGLNAVTIEKLAQTRGVLKASRRDLAIAVAQRRNAATTVAATMFLANAAGISVFATGGIGGAHRNTGDVFDISADLTELGRTPVLVVCAGAKAILDLARTLEILETLSVPVWGYRCDEFPAFYVRSSGLPVPARLESPVEAAGAFHAHLSMGSAGAILCQPVAESVALDSAGFASALQTAENEAAAKGISGARLTPFLLAALAELTHGQSLRANRDLIVANARLAAEVAVAYAAEKRLRH